MFHQVSWQTYFIAFAIIAGLYYLVVIFLFFRKEINHMIKLRCNNHPDVDKGTPEADWERKVSNDDYTTYQLLRGEITAFLESSEPDTFKSDILFSLASIIKKHPLLQDTRFQEALNKEIKRMYLQKYNDGITDEELTALWRA